MRLTITKSKNFEFLYIQKDLYLRDVRGKKANLNPSGKERTTVTVKKLGRIPDLMDEMHLSRDEVIAWAKEQARIMTEEEKKNNEKMSKDCSPAAISFSSLFTMICALIIYAAISPEDMLSSTVLMPFSLISFMPESLIRPVSSLLLNSASLYWNLRSMNFMMFTELYPFWLRNPIISRRKSIKTVILSLTAIIKSFIMTAPITSLRSRKMMISGNTARVKKTDPTLLFRWACLWMETVSLWLSVFSPETRMSSLH